MQRKYAATGAFVMLIVVVLGAFGAHILEPQIGEKAVGTYETGVHYHMIHGIAILLASFASGLGAEQNRLLWANRLFLLGIILFSGSLYMLAITGWKWFGPITPLGGVSFIAGWLMFALALLKKGK